MRHILTDVCPTFWVSLWIGRELFIYFALFDSYLGIAFFFFVENTNISYTFLMLNFPTMTKFSSVLCCSVSCERPLLTKCWSGVCELWGKVTCFLYEHLDLSFIVNKPTAFK